MTYANIENSSTQKTNTEAINLDLKKQLTTKTNHKKLQNKFTKEHNM
jgi:hypothetical protein